jgi:hypothetical protein
MEKPLINLERQKKLQINHNIDRKNKLVVKKIKVKNLFHLQISLLRTEIIVIYAKMEEI